MHTSFITPHEFDINPRSTKQMISVEHLYFVGLNRIFTNLHDIESTIATGRQIVNIWRFFNRKVHSVYAKK